jgi:hypothetical protein
VRFSLASSPDQGRHTSSDDDIKNVANAGCNDTATAENSCRIQTPAEHSRSRYVVVVREKTVFFGPVLSYPCKTLSGAGQPNNTNAWGNPPTYLEERHGVLNSEGRLSDIWWYSRRWLSETFSWIAEAHSEWSWSPTAPTPQTESVKPDAAGLWWLSVVCRGFLKC